MNKFLHTLPAHPFTDAEIQLLTRNIQAAAHERQTWRGADFSASDFFAGAFVFFATFPGAGPMPNQLLDAGRGGTQESFFMPTPAEEIHQLANSVQIDIHEGVLQPDEWQPVIDTVRTWLRQLSPHPQIPPLPITELAELLEDAELTAYYNAKQQPAPTGNLSTIRTWLTALQATRTNR